MGHSLKESRIHLLLCRACQEAQPKQLEGGDFWPIWPVWNWNVCCFGTCHVSDTLGCCPTAQVYEGTQGTQIFITQPAHGMLLAVRLDMEAATPAERARVAEQIYVGGRPVGLRMAH
eukprot:366552-Chlamydomonas_euryale.AAC.15